MHPAAAAKNAIEQALAFPGVRIGGGVLRLGRSELCHRCGLQRLGRPHILPNERACGGCRMPGVLSAHLRPGGRLLPVPAGRDGLVVARLVVVHGIVTGDFLDKFFMPSRSLSGSVRHNMIFSMLSFISCNIGPTVIAN